MPPDETTNADVSVVATQAPVVAEPTTVSELEPVAVVESVVVATPAVKKRVGYPFLTIH